MPGMTGAQLAHAIQFVLEDPPPVFLISGRDLRTFDDAVPGVVRVFQKPFDPDQLLEAIKRHARRR
jgi:DNA-binding NtrC family response regulator